MRLPDVSSRLASCGDPEHPPLLDQGIDVDRGREDPWQLPLPGPKAVLTHASVEVDQDLTDRLLGSQLSQRFWEPRGLLAQGDRGRQGTGEVELFTRGQLLDERSSPR